MTKNYLIPLISLVIAFSSVKAEIIDGPANFRLRPNGPILFSLKDGQEVECGFLKNGWYQVSIDIGVTEQQFKDRYDVKKGDKLIDFHGKLISVALSNIPSESTRLSSGDMEIFGYVSKSNIKPNSIPENTLESLIRVNNSHLQYDAFKGLLSKEKYEKENLIKKTLPGLAVYYIYESTVIDPSPISRIALYFENGELIAIEHSRPLNIGHFGDYKVFEENRLLIIRPPKGLSDKQFVEKVSEAYAGSD